MGYYLFCNYLVSMNYDKIFLATPYWGRGWGGAKCKEMV